VADCRLNVDPRVDSGILTMEDAMRKSVLWSAIILSFAQAAAAKSDIDQLQNVGQSDFRLLSEDLGAALSYKPLVAPMALGLTGFDVGVEATATKLEHKDVLDNVTSGNAPSTLVIPKIHVHKGLPFGFDIGASYSAVPGTNISLWGAEVRYALLEGGLLRPTVSLRGSMSRMSGVDQLGMNTRGLDISIAKGFALLTPYAGLGKVWVTSTPRGVPTLTEERFSLNKVYAGANLNLGLTNFDFELDRTGDATSYGVKVGFRF
jgi:hypothetical protein